MPSFYDPEDEGLDVMRSDEPSVDADPQWKTLSQAPQEFQRQSSPAPSFQEPEDNFQDIELPSTVPSFVDTYNKSKMGKIKQLEDSGARKPLFMVNGQYSTKLPDESQYGTYVPISGPIQRTGAQFSGVPVQFEEAQKLKSDLIPTSDQDIHSNRDKIFQSILQGAEGNLTPETFNDNPYWKTLEQQGMTGEALNAVKRSVLHAIKPEVQKYNRIQRATTALQDVVGDKDTGELAGTFLQNTMPQRPSHDFFGSTKWFGILNAANDKADLIQNDPTLKDMFGEIQQKAQSGDRDATADLKRIMFAKSSSSVNSIFDSYAQRKERSEKQKELLHDVVNNKFKDLDDKDSTEYWKMTNELIDQGKYEGVYGNTKLREDLNSLFKNPDPKDGYAAGPLWVASIHRDVKNGIDRRISDGSSIDDLWVTKDRKVVDQETADKITEKEIKNTFKLDKPSQHISGDWVKVPADTFQTAQGQAMWLPFTVRHKEDLYVRKDVLKKAGITSGDLMDDEGNFKTFEVGSDKSKWFQNKVDDFEPNLLRATDFVGSKPGEEFLKKKSTNNWLNAVSKDIEQKVKEFPDEPVAPSSVGEFAKSLIRPVIRDVASVWHPFNPLFYSALGTETYNLGMALAHELGGFKGKSVDYYNKALGKGDQLSLANLSESVEKALNSDVPVLGALKENKNLSPEQHLLTTLAGGVGTIVGFTATAGTSALGKSGSLLAGTMSAEEKAKNLVGAWKTLEKLEGSASSWVPAVKKFQELKSLGGSAVEIEEAAKKAKRAKEVIFDALLFPAMAIMHGFDPKDSKSMLGDMWEFSKEMGWSGLEGLIMGHFQRIGKGIGKEKTLNLIPEKGGGFREFETVGKFHYLPDAKRVGATAAGQTVLFGEQYLRQLTEGKSSAEIMDSFTNKENAIGNIMNTLFMLIGRSDVKVRPERPARTVKEAAAQRMPDAALVGSAKEIKQEISNLQEELKPEAVLDQDPAINTALKKMKAEDMDALIRIHEDAMARDAQQGIEAPEVVLEAALRGKDGTIYRGKNHPEALLDASLKLTGKKFNDLNEAEQDVVFSQLEADDGGFVTDKGNYVDRKRAAELQQTKVVDEKIGLTSEELKSKNQILDEKAGKIVKDIFDGKIKTLDEVEKAAGDDHILDARVRSMVDEHPNGLIVKPLGLTHFEIIKDPHEADLDYSRILERYSAEKPPVKEEVPVESKKEEFPHYPEGKKGEVIIAKEEKAKTRGAKKWEWAQEKGRGKTKQLAKNPEGNWVATVQASGKGRDKYVIPKSEKLSESEARVQAEKYFNDKYPSQKEEFQGQVAEELHPKASQTPVSDILGREQQDFEDMATDHIKNKFAKENVDLFADLASLSVPGTSVSPQRQAEAINKLEPLVNSLMKLGMEKEEAFDVVSKAIVRANDEMMTEMGKISNEAQYSTSLDEVQEVTSVNLTKAKASEMMADQVKQLEAKVKQNKLAKKAKEVDDALSKNIEEQRRNGCKLAVNPKFIK